jgi:hypothetical protein
MAQRAIESGGDVVYMDAKRNRTNLGAGFSPVSMQDGRVAFLRGRKFGYGEKFDCAHKESRNWVELYNPADRSDTVLFDQTVPFDGGKWKFCVFSQMQMSPDGTTLYLVASVYATSGSLAIIRLNSGTISYVPGVNMVFVIEAGSHRGELICQRRMWHSAPTEQGRYPYYPFVHARADGTLIRVLAEEFFTVGGGTDTPVLKAYLRRIGGSIHVNGDLFP